MHASAARYVANRLIYPRNLAVLPLLCLAATKFGALRGSRKDVAPDERISMGFDVMCLNTDQIAHLCYPGLYLVSDPSGPWGTIGHDGQCVMPPRLPLTLERLDLKGAYLLDTGRIFVLLLGRAVAPEFIMQVRGGGWLAVCWVGWDGVGWGGVAVEEWARGCVWERRKGSYRVTWGGIGVLVSVKHQPRHD